MAGRGMPAAGKGAGWPGPAPGPAVALLPPAHCAVDVRPGAAGRRRRPQGTARREPFAQQRRRAARGLARHREAARQSRRSASRWRPRPSQGQRPRSPSARLPGHSADELCRPRPGLRLVTMAPTPSGPGPMAPLPRPAQSRPRDFNHATALTRSAGNHPAHEPAPACGPGSGTAGRTSRPYGGSSR
jgi:hypothetical protein